MTKSKSNAKGVNGKKDGIGTVADLIGPICDTIKICSQCAKEIERYKTEQVRIVSETRIEIERIRNRREIFILFMEKTFSERKDNFQKLFDSLDDALAGDDPQNVKLILDTMVEFAKTSPFDALRDAASAKAVISDKSTSWEF